MNDNTVNKNLGVKNLTRKELMGFFAALNESGYRADLVFKAIYRDKIEKFSDITTLSKALRERLDKIFYINSFKEIARDTSEDEATKFVFSLTDGRLIESVAIKNRNKSGKVWYTACLSTQVGCALGCLFCATGRMGFIRNLEAGEIVEQLLQIEHTFPISNIVLMGMGEPFLNYENMKKAIEILTDAKGRALGKRKITISTAGIIPFIYKLTEEMPSVGLAISLHSAIQSKRDALMPGVKNEPLSKLKEALVQYTEKTGNTVTLEYLLIDGINDTTKDAKALINFTKGIKFLKVNLIRYNRIPGVHFEPSKRETQFQKELLNAHIRATVRVSKGTGISAACGQLATEESNAIKGKS